MAHRHAASVPRDDRQTRSWVSLLYHDVMPFTSASGGGPERFAVPLATFERTLDVIRDHGYLGCSLDTALREPGRKRVAITFDDGTRTQFDHAVPALRSRGMTATIYVTTDWIGRPGYMTWDELRQLTDWGISIQSHTRSHPFLSELAGDAVHAELAESKAALDRELGQDTSEVALPGGDAPARRFSHLLNETGYRVVATSRWGVNADPWKGGGARTIRRCTARGDLSSAAALRVIAGDPWLSLLRLPREAALARIRAALGPTRYARWRRRLLDTLSGGSR